MHFVFFLDREEERDYNKTQRKVKENGAFMRKFGLSARSYGRILKISRTIADLDGDDFISLAHISKALQFRNLDKLLNK